MTPYYTDDWLTIYSGDAATVLATLPADSVDCVCTSPPYWGLRDYGSDGQLGLERTPEEYVANMVAVFREVRRVLKPSGTCWLNLGDSYNGNPASGGERVARVGDKNPGEHRRTPSRQPFAGLKPKDLVGIPWRVAFALQADGWYLRSDIIWAKPNPMPESVTDRPTKSHEYLFLLTKSARYYFDADAVREPHIEKHLSRYGYDFWPEGTKEANGGGRPDGASNTGGPKQPNPAGRNIRSVWNIATRPYPGAHFAVFPPELPERCIKAGSSEKGVCPECGAPWERVSVPTDEWAANLTRPNLHKHDQQAFGAYLTERRNALGFSRADVSYIVVGTRSGACWNWEHHQPPRWDLYLVLKEALGMDDRFDEFLKRIEQNSRFRERVERVGERGTFSEGRDKPKDYTQDKRQTVTWRPACGHGVREAIAPRPEATSNVSGQPEPLLGGLEGRTPIPAVVLDPFAGSGTTGMVAQKLGRRAILIDLNPDYLKQQLARNAQTPLGLDAA